MRNAERLQCAAAFADWLQVDVESDEVVFNHLRSCGTVKSASSEEQTECQDLSGQGYSVSQTHRLPCRAVKGWLPQHAVH